ncbi:MAG: TolC family protein [Campylobacterota bacterium]|nr:TolC family protein [Campylobacterota bacterium]
MKTYNKLILASFLLGSSAIANDNDNEDILSQNKLDILNYSYEKAIEDSNKLSKDWINPITYKFIYNNGETYDTQKSYISISQPIFKSGGIYSAIKYASSMEKYSKTSVDTQKKELIKQALNLLFQIHKIDITINKQKLLIDNATLDVNRKKEQVLNGILDSSFLDNSILDLNTKRNSLIDLEYQKTELINSFSTLSTKEYDSLALPTLLLTSQDKFVENNIYIKQQKEDIDNSYWIKRMTTENYLPTINLTADHTEYHDNDNYSGYQDNSNIGFNITIPLDIKYSNTIESSKIAYLQKKSSLKDQEIQEINIYKNSLAKIESLDKKIQIAKSDVKLYDSLLTQMQEQLSVGLKTLSDVQTMKNSKQIKALDIKSLNIDKQLELLEIYSRVEINNE